MKKLGTSGKATVSKETLPLDQFVYHIWNQHNLWVRKPDIYCKITERWLKYIYNKNSNFIMKQGISLNEWVLCLHYVFWPIIQNRSVLAKAIRYAITGKQEFTVIIPKLPKKSNIGQKWDNDTLFTLIAMNLLKDNNIKYHQEENKTKKNITLQMNRNFAKPIVCIHDEMILWTEGLRIYHQLPNNYKSNTLKLVIFLLKIAYNNNLYSSLKLSPDTENKIGDKFVYDFIKILSRYIKTRKKIVRYCMGSSQKKSIVVCDHLFPDSALAALHAQTKNIPIIIAPHSQNPSMYKIWPRNLHYNIMVTLEQNIPCWEKYHPNSFIKKTHSIALPSLTKKSQLWDKNSPVTLVILDNALRLGLLPLIERKSHDTMLCELLQWAGSLKGKINVLIKLKQQNKNYYQEKAPDGAFNIEYSHTPLDQLTMPNQVYISVSLRTSAIMEGILHGIPGLCLNEAAPHAQYIEMHECANPATNPAELWNLLEPCITARDFHPLQALAAQQQAWLKEQTEGAIDFFTAAKSTLA